MLIAAYGINATLPYYPSQNTISSDGSRATGDEFAPDAFSALKIPQITLSVKSNSCPFVVTFELFLYLFGHFCYLLRIFRHLCSFLSKNLRDLYVFRG
jgi:hypothetical protein